MWALENSNAQCWEPNKVPLQSMEPFTLQRPFAMTQNTCGGILGIIFLLMIVLCTLYLMATEYISAQRSKGEILLFRRGQVPNLQLIDEKEARSTARPPLFLDEKITEAGSKPSIHTDRDVARITWDSLDYDVKVKGGRRQILNDVEGWIKPGTLTALMGASGAGKTKLLNVLADRTSTGIVSGDKSTLDGHRNNSFARKIGYAQQQDFHLETSTVREALTFRANLRQCKTCAMADRLAWVEEIIETLDMKMFADAIIGIPSEGLIRLSHIVI